MIHLGPVIKLISIFFLVLAIGFIAGGRGGNQVEDSMVISEIAGATTENSTEITPSPTLNPILSKPTVVPTLKPTASPLPVSSPQPSSIPIVVYQVNPSPIPTTPPVIYQSSLDSEVNKVIEEQRRACLAERDAATSSLRIELQGLLNEYDALPEQITQAMAGKDVSANQLQRMIESRQFEKLEEINDVNSQIQGVEIQHSCY